MEIGIVEIRSAITPLDEKKIKNLFNGIEAACGFPLKVVTIDEYAKQDFGLIFIGTGGSEGIFLESIDKLATKPCYIISSGESNSFAASLEILSYLKQNGFTGEVLQGTPEYIGSRVRSLYMVHTARKHLKTMKLGCIGKPSDWLIASNTDGSELKKKIGTELLYISMDELLSEYKKGGYPENEWTEKLLKMGYDHGEMVKSLNIYGATRRIVDKYGLGGVTTRCFDLLDTVHTTGCLAASILNAEGIYCGCEGDVPALISMAILGEISGQPVFLCNPNRIDMKKGEMVFAHCTLPLDMPQKMALTTHYESGIGVAIAADLKEDAITIFKASADLSRHFVEEGEIIENLHEEKMCRTQIRIKIPNYQYFINDPIANHHLICAGKHKEMIEEFFASI